MKTKLLAAFFSLSSAVAFAGAMTGGATEVTQIANNLQLMMSYAEQAQQTVHQMNMYQAMLKNLMKNGPSATLDQQAYQLFRDQNMVGAFKQLRQVVIGGQKIAYSQATFDSQFKTLHPGYGNYGDGANYSTAYRNWSDTTHDSVENSLNMVNAQADSFDSEEAMVSELNSRSQSAEGQLQALQAGNSIGVSMIGQMQKLRQLQMAQMQAQGSYMAGQQSRQDVDDDVLKKFMNRPIKRIQTAREIEAAERAK